MPAVHGAPVHIGTPAALGITDLNHPDFGDPLDSAPGDVPVFWACGVTTQAALMASRPPFAITHAPRRRNATSTLSDTQHSGHARSSEGREPHVITGDLKSKID
jgi:uncharacterized protein YcsI (UPF0317 family)